LSGSCGAIGIANNVVVSGKVCVTHTCCRTCCTAAALAGPVWSKLPQPVYHNSAATVVLLNLSDTMNASDVTPSRLERAKLKLLDFLRRQREGQTALIGYAGEAYVVSPLTDDAATIESLVTSLSTGIMPVPGNNLSEALQKADTLLNQDGVYKGGRVLLITDDAGDSLALKSVAALQHNGRTLSVLAVGTKQGAPIAAAGGGFLKDSHGAIVIPMLDRTALAKLAAVGHGHLVMLTATDNDLNHLWPTSQATLVKPQHKHTQQAANVWREEGPWLLLLVLPVLALLWRQGWLALVVLAVVLQPPPVHAATWGNLWARPDQQAYRALQHGDAKTAARLFKDSRWRSVAQYRAGNYAAAATEFGKQHTPDALYNQGNALARAGKLEAAAQNYRKVLQHQPDNADAQHNLKIVEDLLKRRQQKQNSNKNPKGGKSRHQHSQNSSQGKSGQQQSQGAKHKQPGQHPQQNANAGQAGQKPSQDKQNSQANSQKAGKQQQAQSDKKNAAQQQHANKQQAKSASINSHNAAQAKKPEQEKQGQVRQQAAARPQNPSSDQHAATPAHETTAHNESNQALQQWLRRIPDDPGGLLRRKFMLQHQQREQAAGNNGT
jgi:Ca-activated chloride channel family protein